MSSNIIEKKIVLFLMTKKGYDVLRAICEKSPSIISCVVSSKDPNVVKDYYCEIKDLCAVHGVTFYDRKNPYKISAPYIMAVSWRWLIHAGASILIVFHDSLLPKYRGFNPLVSALINGEERIGVTAILGRREFDKGPMIAQSFTRVSYPLKIARAIDIVSFNYQKVAKRVVEQIRSNKTFVGKEQEEKDASYSLWRDDEDYKIDWGRDSEEIKRFIDAVGFPYKGACSSVNGRNVIILDADPVEDIVIENRVPGKVIFRLGLKPVVVCGKGLLKINKMMDRESGRTMSPIQKFRIRFK